MDYQTGELCGFHFQWNTEQNRSIVTEAFFEVWELSRIPFEDRDLIRSFVKRITLEGSPEIMPGRGREIAPIGVMAHDGILTINAHCCHNPDFVRFVVAHELGHARQFAAGTKFELEDRELELVGKISAWDRCEKDADKFAASIGHPRPGQQEKFIERGLPDDREFMTLAKLWPTVSEAKRLEILESVRNETWRE
ncbi:MAG: hypothetical protein NXI32_26970 [bacterium]|nr:hypothetical protein [bacterium]